MKMVRRKVDNRSSSSGEEVGVNFGRSTRSKDQSDCATDGMTADLTKPRIYTVSLLRRRACKGAFRTPPCHLSEALAA